MASLHLHNYYVKNRIELSVEDELHAQQLHDDMISPIGIMDEASGINTRDSIVRNYFEI